MMHCFRIKWFTVNLIFSSPRTGASSAHLHPLDGEEGGQVGCESGQHQDDKQPVGGHQGAAREGLRRLPAALRRERRQREPEALLQRECPVGERKRTGGGLWFNRIATKRNRGGGGGRSLEQLDRGDQISYISYIPYTTE